MARANSLIFPRSTVTTNGGDSLPMTPLLIWIAMGRFLPRDVVPLQGRHPSQYRLDSPPVHTYLCGAPPLALEVRMAFGTKFVTPVLAGLILLTGAASAVAQSKGYR